MRGIETQIMPKEYGRMSLDEEDMPNKDLKVDDEIEVPVKAKLKSIHRSSYGDKKKTYEFEITHVKSVNPVIVKEDKGETVVGRKIVR